MKKVFFIGLPLIIFLVASIFSVRAATQTAVDGFEWSSDAIDWNSYVNESDTYVWIYQNGTCVEVKKPSINTTTKSYATESACKSANPAVSGSTPNFNWTSTNVATPDTPQASGGVVPQISGSPVWGGGAVTPQGGTPGTVTPQVSSGFGGFNWSGAVTPQGGTPGTVTPQISGTKLFGTDIAHDTNITGIKPLSVGGLGLAAESTIAVDGFEGMLNSLLRGIATDLGFKPKISENNNLWKFAPVSENVKPMGGGDINITATPEEISGKGDITFNWDGSKILEATDCWALLTLADNWKASQPVGLKGPRTVSLIFDTNKEESYSRNITIKCGKDKLSAVESNTVKITLKPGDDQDQDPDTPNFTFEAKDTKLTLNKEGKAQTTLKWDIDSKIFSSCKTTAVDGTDWKEMEIKRKKDGSKVVNFDKVDKEINYIFTITCETTTDKKKVINTAEVTVSKEDAPPGGDFKEPSWEAKQQINNDCSLSFKSLSTPTGSLLDAKGNLVSSLNAELVFACNNNKLEDKGSSTAVGYDARPFEYGLYIDVYNKNNFGVTPYPCATPVQPGGDEIVNTKNNFANLSCNPSTLSDAKAIQTALANNQVVRVVGYIDYKTYEITGFHHGQEHTVRLTNTTDKLGVGTGPAKPPEGDKLPTVTLSVDKTQVKCEEAVTLTATVENNGKSANCKLTSVNDNSKKPDEAWNSNQVINGKFEKKITLMGSSDKDVVYTYGIQCFKDDKDTTGVKATDIQIKVPKCVAGEGKTEWGEICNSTKEKCNKGQIQWSNQVNLNFENNEYKVKNSSALNFGVDFKCDTNPFEASFARLTIEDKIVQDVRLNKGAQSRVFAIPNIWEKLSDTTRNNIINTFKNCNGCDSVTIAKEKIWVARWNTFDEKNTLKKPEIDCNYSGDHPPSDLVFVGHNLPKKQAPGGGEGGDNENLELSADKTNISVNDIVYFTLKGQLPDTAKTIKCDFIENDSTIIENTDFNQLKQMLSKGETFSNAGTIYRQVVCKDENENKYFSNTVTIVVGDIVKKGSAMITMNVPKCGPNNTYGIVVIANESHLNISTKMVLGAWFSLYGKSGKNFAEEHFSNGDIMLKAFSNQSYIKTDFPASKSNDPSEKKSILIFCDFPWRPASAQWGLSFINASKGSTIFSDRVLPANTTTNIPVMIEKEGEYTGGVKFKCGNCQLYCSHITILRPSNTGISGWNVYKDNISIRDHDNHGIYTIKLPYYNRPYPNWDGKYQVIVKNCKPPWSNARISFANSAWKIDSSSFSYSRHLFADFYFSGNIIDLGTITFEHP